MDKLDNKTYRYINIMYIWKRYSTLVTYDVK